MSDGYQTLTLPAFRQLMAECRKVAEAVGREWTRNSPQSHREKTLWFLVFSVFSVTLW